MAIKTTRVTVGTTAVPLNAQLEGDSKEGRSMLLSCPVDIFIGGLDVTIGNGFKVAAGGALALDLQPDTKTSASAEQVFAVVASGTTTVSVLQQGL